MRPITYRFFSVAVGFACISLSSVGQAADAYPDHTVRLIVPSSPGSTLDLVARTFGPPLSKELKQSFVVENKAGASNITGTREVVVAPPNGYTIGMISSNHAVNPSLHKRLPYDSIRDITPITIIGTTPLVLVVPKNSPYKTVDQLITAAKAHPGKINYGSAGTGTALHLAALMFTTKAHVDMMHIPYKGGNPLITDLMSGQIDFAFLGMPSVLAQVNAGTLHALAVTTLKRSTSMPNVPTLDESGLKGYDYDPWIALFGPAKLPSPITQKLQSEVHKILHRPDVEKQFAVQGFVATGSSSVDALATIKNDIKLSADLLKAAHIKAMD
ncbi:Bug family tripartite tricarboxylate transporter substrate binding protein [Paralcaligenes ureilyticus]|uniref:Tripartite-type tricarboxylate transporter receptor subunit TctC n=1 Tax=Paralcaligenes ureilyticus TaxID=627131 RepID=A0A4R3LR57_9BURK|nr:tripartite tricarboxylate transporter substrate binding protein [Paralcaligenes ureilyticus]TCT02761.1 tripartite-type tricarboxylate transporter receptor subunit TctC [Paralcaligenes ureilyticus]